MTFAEQRLCTIVVGLAAGTIAGLAALSAFVVAPDKGGGSASFVLGVTMIAGVAICFVSLIFGVFMRSAHRWLWFNASRQSTLTIAGRTQAERILGGFDKAFWRWWLHIDPKGNDLDGSH
jgi:disulfide bond formation protein DsbB